MGAKISNKFFSQNSHLNSIESTSFTRDISQTKKNNFKDKLRRFLSKSQSPNEISDKKDHSLSNTSNENQLKSFSHNKESNKSKKEFHYSNFFTEAKKPVFFSPRPKAMIDSPRRSAFQLTNMMQLNKKISLITKKKNIPNSKTSSELRELMKKCEQFDKKEFSNAINRKNSNPLNNYRFFNNETNAKFLFEYNSKKKSKSQNSNSDSLSLNTGMNWKNIDLKLPVARNVHHEEIRSEYEYLLDIFSQEKKKKTSKSSVTNQPIIAGLLQNINKEKGNLKILKRYCLQKNNSNANNNFLKKDNDEKSLGRLQNMTIENKSFAILNPIKNLKDQSHPYHLKKNCGFYKDKIIQVVDFPKENEPKEKTFLNSPIQTKKIYNLANSKSK